MKFFVRREENNWDANTKVFLNNVFVQFSYQSKFISNDMSCNFRVKRVFDKDHNFPPGESSIRK